MEHQRVQRRLTAIVAADVAGYSRLTGADEEGTIARLRSLRREVVDPAVTAHGGRIVKTTGDGVLIEFASVVDAVRCAVIVQQAIVGRNSSADADKCIKFRLGVDLGEHRLKNIVQPIRVYSVVLTTARSNGPLRLAGATIPRMSFVVLPFVDL